MRIDKDMDLEYREHNRKIYDELLSVYEGLNDYDKYVLKLYKSILFIFMQGIMNIPNYINISGKEIFEILKKSDLFTKIEDVFRAISSDYGLGYNIKNSFPFLNEIFSKTKDSDEIYSMIFGYLKEYTFALENMFDREEFELSEDIVVYRARSSAYSDGGLSSSKIVSTSISPSSTFNFLKEPGYDFITEKTLGTMYKLDLKKGTKVLVCPVGYKNGVEIESSQHEIIINNDNIVSDLTYNGKIGADYYGYYVDYVSGEVSPNLEKSDGLI